MTRGIRVLVALGLAFVVWRIAVELIPLPVAFGLGLITGGSTWALTAPKSAS